MANETRDYETLKCLFDLETSICNEYKRLESGEFSVEKMLVLLTLESDLLDTFDITHDRMIKIEREIESEIGANFDVSIPLGLTPYMTDETYPYIRMLARLRYTYRAKSDNAIDTSFTPLLNLEIGLLYKTLIHDAHIYRVCKSAFRKCAWQILVDSPVLEMEIVKNGMQPVETVDDIVGLQMDLINILAIKRDTGKAAYPRETGEFLVRQLRFSRVSSEVFTFIKNYINLYLSGQNSDINVLSYFSYLKVIIATQDSKTRDKLHEELSSKNLFGISAREYEKLVADSFKYIEDALVPCIRRVSFVNNSNMIN